MGKQMFDVSRMQTSVMRILRKKLEAVELPAAAVLEKKNSGWPRLGASAGLDCGLT